MDDLDTVYVVHTQEDCHPFGYTCTICRDWPTALWNANMQMGDICSEEWEEHEVPKTQQVGGCLVTPGLKARWTWGFNEVRITTETVL